MEKMKVRFHVRYEYVPEYGTYRAEITLCMPVEDDDEYEPALHPIFRNKREVFGERLKEYFGWAAKDKKWRCRTAWVRNDDPCALRNDARAIIDEAIEILRSVLEENRRRFAAVPCDEELEVEL